MKFREPVLDSSSTPETVPANQHPVREIVSVAAETDDALLERFRDGDEAAAAELYVRYGKRLARLADGWIAADLRSRFDAEDVVQSVFRTFFRRASSGEYEAPDESELWRLLLTIALNKLRNRAHHHRAAKRSAARTLPLVSDRASGDSSSGGEEEGLLLQWVIDELLASGAESRRRIVELRILGCTVEEIADSVQRSRRTVERTLQEFRQTLIEALDEN